MNLNVGCNFSNEHVNAIVELCAYQLPKANTTITEVYGSPGKLNPLGSVRPRFREKDIESKVFIKNVKTLRNLGIKINLTLNSLLPTMIIKDNIYYPKGFYRDSIVVEALANFLDIFGRYIDAIIVSHPSLIDLLHTSPKLEKDIIISTIMNVHSTAQVVWIKNNWPKVKRICTALWRNRDFDWLNEVNKIINVELLVNEFCSIGGVECEGLFRQACYLSQSINSAWNPMTTRCISSRRTHPESWLMAKFILPQWIRKYKEITGIDYYKITGRTHNAQFLLKIYKMYIDEIADCNLLELWGHLEATLDPLSWYKQQRAAVDIINIPTKEVDRLFEIFRRCNSNDCGYKCQFCREMINKFLS